MHLGELAYVRLALSIVPRHANFTYQNHKYTPPSVKLLAGTLIVREILMCKGSET
jgi:hypothetical protein